VDIITAEEIWKRDHKATERTRLEEIHVLGGSVLPFWGLFEQYLETTKEKTQVLRLQTDCGKRIVGVQIPKDRVDIILEKMPEWYKTVTATADFMPDTEMLEEESTDSDTGDKNIEEEVDEQIIQGVGQIKEDFSDDDDW